MKLIDGSVLEGGGQIVRVSMALSAICNIPIKITKIRAGRSKPGLAAQHLMGLKLVRDMCNGILKGGDIGSTEVEFTPGKLKGGTYTADIKTAGATSLLLQIALPCAFFCDGTVHLKLMGGTDADMAPPIDYMNLILGRHLANFGAKFSVHVRKRGFFPRGGGVVDVEVDPLHSLSSANMTSVTSFDDITNISGLSFVAGVLPERMSVDMLEGAKKVLRKKIVNAQINVDALKLPPSEAVGNGSGILLACSSAKNIFGASQLGKRGVQAFEIGVSAAKELIETISEGASVDKHAQDQLIIFMALAQGTSYLRVGEVTLHTKTAIHIIELLTDIKFDILNESDSSHIITCTGLGLINTSKS